MILPCHLTLKFVMERLHVSLISRAQDYTLMESDRKTFFKMGLQF